MTSPIGPRIRAAAGLLACLGLLFVAGCGKATPTCSPGTAECTRVLFLGNSYTYVNDLPRTFAELAQSAGHQVEVAMVANGGETLDQHASSTESLDQIAAGGWTYVVLQEQSQMPATAAGRDCCMYPAVRLLARQVELAGTWPLLFMTWAHRDGMPDAGLPGYESMQSQIDGAYSVVARELDVPVAPVGFTWWAVRRDHPEIALWSDDGSHPSKAGTYLAACVFYVAVFRRSPVGLSFHGGISGEDAGILQAEADANVLDLQAEWGLR